MAAITIMVIVRAIPVIIAELVFVHVHILRSIEPKDKTYDQTSNQQSSNNGSNVQVGSNHSLLFGNFAIDSSNCGILFTLYNNTIVN